MNYPIIRLDNMSGTKDGTLLRSVKFYDGTKYAAIDNGSILALNGLVTGEREIYQGIAPATDTVAKNKLVLIAAPELMYDERLKNLDDFTNAAGVPARAYVFHTGDMFGLTSDGFTIAGGVTVAKGYAVEINATETKMTIVATATASTTQIGVVSDIETVGTKTYYTVTVG